MVRLGAVISPDRGKGKSATYPVHEHRTGRQHTEDACESTVALSVLEDRKESTLISISEKVLQTMQQHFLPIVPWIGGKRRLAKQILPRFPAHICYVEPFCGAAALFFMKSPSKAEVINDINGELVNLYRVLKHHLEEFMRQFKWALVSRAIYQWLNITPTETLTDIQRAARFYYLQKQAFGGKVAEHTFGVTTTTAPRLNLLRMEEELSLAHLRLSRTTIEQLDWASCIARYDRPHTLFYCDPPYWGTEGYGVDFGLEQYEKLAGMGRDLAGMMIISVNDIPEMREVFQGFEMESVPIRYSLNSNQPTQRRELIITVK